MYPVSRKGSLYVKYVWQRCRPAVYGTCMSYVYVRLSAAAGAVAPSAVSVVVAAAAAAGARVAAPHRRVRRGPAPPRGVRPGPISVPTVTVSAAAAATTVVLLDADIRYLALMTPESRIIQLLDSILHVFMTQELNHTGAVFKGVSKTDITSFSHVVLEILPGS